MESLQYTSDHLGVNLESWIEFYLAVVGQLSLLPTSMLLGSESSAEVVSTLSLSPVMLSPLLCDLALALHNI